MYSDIILEIAKNLVPYDARSLAISCKQYYKSVTVLLCDIFSYNTGLVCEWDNIKYLRNITMSDNIILMNLYDNNAKILGRLTPILIQNFEHIVLNVLNIIIQQNYTNTAMEIINNNLLPISYINYILSNCLKNDSVDIFRILYNKHNYEIDNYSMFEYLCRSCKYKIITELLDNFQVYILDFIPGGLSRAIYNNDLYLVKQILYKVNNSQSNDWLLAGITKSIVCDNGELLKILLDDDRVYRSDKLHNAIVSTYFKNNFNTKYILRQHIKTSFSMNLIENGY